MTLTFSQACNIFNDVEVLKDIFSGNMRGYEKEVEEAMEEIQKSRFNIWKEKESDRWLVNYKIEKLQKKLEKARFRRKLWKNRLDILNGKEDAQTEVDFDEIRRTPIINFLQGKHHINSPKGRYYNCIFHNEKTPSMLVDNNNRFYCFGCGKNGSVIDIVMHIHNCDIKKAIHILK